MRPIFFAIAIFFFGFSVEQASAQSADYSQEGWIIRRTDKGIIKIPRKQKFRFEGAEITGSAKRPTQSILGSRVSRQNTSLIPVRRSFKEEFLNVSGLQER